MEKDSSTVLKLDVSDYEFKSFSKPLKDPGSVKSYSFSEFQKNFVEDVEYQDEIKQERKHALKSNFKIAPIVKEHRGLIKQENLEKERRVQEEVERRVEEIRKKAFRKGYEDGVKSGREETFNQTRMATEEKLTALTALISDVLKTKAEILTKEKDDIQKLVRTLTKWVILREIKEDNDYLSRLLEKLIIEMQTKSNLLIHVNQKDFERMPEVLDHVIKTLGNLPNVRVEIDFDIQDHGIVLESENGIINGTLKEQLTSIDRVFEAVGVDEKDENINLSEREVEKDEPLEMKSEDNLETSEDQTPEDEGEGGDLE